MGAKLSKLGKRFRKKKRTKPKDETQTEPTHKTTTLSQRVQTPTLFRSLTPTCIRRIEDSPPRSEPPSPEIFTGRPSEVALPLGVTPVASVTGSKIQIAFELGDVEEHGSVVEEGFPEQGNGFGALTPEFVEVCDVAKSIEVGVEAIQPAVKVESMQLFLTELASEPAPSGPNTCDMDRFMQEIDDIGSASSRNLANVEVLEHSEKRQRETAKLERSLSQKIQPITLDVFNDIDTTTESSKSLINETTASQTNLLDSPVQSPRESSTNLPSFQISDSSGDAYNARALDYKVSSRVSAASTTANLLPDTRSNENLGKSIHVASLEDQTSRIYVVIDSDTSITSSKDGLLELLDNVDSRVLDIQTIPAAGENVALAPSSWGGSTQDLLNDSNTAYIPGSPANELDEDSLQGPTEKYFAIRRRSVNSDNVSASSQEIVTSVEQLGVSGRKMSIPFDILEEDHIAESLPKSNAQTKSGSKRCEASHSFHGISTAVPNPTLTEPARRKSSDAAALIKGNPDAVEVNLLRDSLTETAREILSPSASTNDGQFTTTDYSYTTDGTLEDTPRVTPRPCVSRGEVSAGVKQGDKTRPQDGSPASPLSKKNRKRQAQKKRNRSRMKRSRSKDTALTQLAVADNSTQQF